MKKETWFDVLCYALTGEDIQKLTTEERKAIESDMVGCLMQIWARCSQDPFYETVRDVDIQPGTHCLTLEEVGGEHLVNDISRIILTSATEDPMEPEQCELACEGVVVCVDKTPCEDEEVEEPETLTKAQLMSGLSETEVQPAKKPNKCGHMPARYEVKADKVQFDRVICADTVATVCFQRYPDCELNCLTTIGEGDSEVEVLKWKCPDIPPEMLFVLKDHVRARLFSLRQDWGNASAQLQLADRGFDGVKEAMQAAEDSKGTQVSTVAYLDGPSDGRCGCREVCTCALKGRGPVEQIRPECWIAGPQDADFQRTHEWSTRRQAL